MKSQSENMRATVELPPQGGLPRRSLFWILEIGGWAVFCGSMFVAGLSNGWTLAFTAVNKVGLTMLGFVLSLVLWRVYLHLARRGTSIPVVGMVAIPASFAAAAVWMAGHRLVLASWSAWVNHAPELVYRDFPDFTNTIYYFFLFVAWSALYIGARAYLDLLEERERVLRIEALAQQARLRALRFQLSPHFLFNALNAISTLIDESRNDEANRMLARLSEFLRATLEGPDVVEITLDEEIAFAKRYLEIEKVRFGDRLHVEWSVTPGLASVLVPVMILQPLVENAVHHAIRDREDGGTIAIVVNGSGQRLRISVEDDGAGLESPDSISEGVGLSNVRQRLREIHGPDASLDLGDGDRGGFRASIEMPLRIRKGGQ